MDQSRCVLQKKTPLHLHVHACCCLYPASLVACSCIRAASVFDREEVFEVHADNECQLVLLVYA